MAVIGVHEVLLVPSLKGGQSAIGRELDKAAGPAGDQAGRTMGTRLGGALKVGAMAVSGAVVGGLGVALTKGFGRLQAIENARAKLSGLGHDAQSVEQIMTNATTAVKGTAFGLGDAATAAAGMVAAGIKPGKELESTLTLVGDAASIAGVGFNDMSAIFQKAAASNKVQMDIINQLHDAGVPALQLIAEEMGVTAEEASKMASKGEVDFDTFSRAMTEGMGGAAQKSGETLQGAFANSMAAIGRFGANLLEGVYPKIRDFFTLFMEWMGPVEDMGKVIGEHLGNAIQNLATWITDTAMPALKRFGDWVRDNQGPITVLAGALVGLFTALAVYKMHQAYVGWLSGMTVATKLWEIAQGNLNLAFLKFPLTWIVVAIGALVAAVIYAYNNFDWFREGVQAAWAGIQSAIDWAWRNVIQPVFQALSGFVTGVLIPVITGLWQNVIQPVFGWIGDRIRDVWNGIIQPAFQALVGFIQNTIIPVITWLWDNVVKPVFGWIGDRIKGVWEGVIKPVFTLLVDIIKFVADKGFTWLWESIIQPVMGWIGDRISEVWNGFVKPVFEAIQGFIRDVLGPVFKWLYESVVQPVFGWIGDRISEVWNGVIKPVFEALGNFIRDHVAPKIERGVQIIGDVWSGLKRLFAEPINWVINTVWNNGLKKAFDAVAEAVGSDARLGTIPLIALGDSSKKGNSKGTGGVTTAGRRAAGGGVEGGRPYLVGEFGPEMIFPDRNGFVATALQTQKMLSAGRDLSDEQSRRAAGRNPREAMAPMGDGFNWGAAGNYLKDQLGLGKLLGTDQLAAGAGQLVKFAKGLLDPVMNSARSFLGSFGTNGQVGLDAAAWGVKKVIDWAGGKDSAADQAMSAGGGFGGDYTGDRSGFARPGSGPITSRFGPRWGGMHSGIDLAMPIGSAVRAAWSGVVQKAAWNALTGRTGMGMVLGHGGGRQSYYGHLSQWLASPGQNVKAGDVIARSGNTGRSTGPHLHFEELQGGRAVNPGYLFRDQGGHLPPGLSMVLNNTGTNEHIFNQKQLGKLDAAVRGNGFPDVVTLVDESGGILTHARLIAGDVVRMDRRQQNMNARRGVKVGG